MFAISTTRGWHMDTNREHCSRYHDQPHFRAEGKQLLLSVINLQLVCISFVFQTQKRRYFILRSPLNGTARLEYFESEKRFRQLQSSPKRTISLASCFNIGRKEDWKNKFVFALYTRDDVFGLIADSDEEMNAWLKCLWEERNKSEIRSDYGEL